MELNNEQHQKTVEELQDKLRDTQSKLKGVIPNDLYL